MNFSDPQKWWDSTFSSSLTRNGLPDPDTMSLFWQKIFPIFSLLSDNITNTDQYWKRIQRIMRQMSSKIDEVPCPFQRLKQFIPTFYQFTQELDPKSISQIFTSLECMPQSYDPQTILWRIPSVIEDPQIFLTILDSLHSSNHWIWNAVVNYDGGCDLIFDRFLPYLIPISDEVPSNIKKFHIITINLIISILTNCSRLPDTFDNFFSSFLLILKKGSPEQSIYCFRLLSDVFKSNRSFFLAEQLSNYVQEFAESSISNAILKPFVGSFVLSLNIPSLSIIYLSNLILKNKPDHNDILFIEHNLLCSNEDASPIILKLLSLSTTDKIYCTVYLHAINTLKPLLSSYNSSISSFIQRAVGFVVIARSHNSKHRTVSMIFDLLKTLTSLGHEWLRNEVSRGASILLASQKVPLAFVNSLRPSMHCDKSELIKFEKMAIDSKLNIKTLLSEIDTLNITPNKSNKEKLNMINSSQSKGKISNSYSVHPKPPIVGTRSAPMRNQRMTQKGNISSISKSKSREVKKPLVKNSQGKFFQNYREIQS